MLWFSVCALARNMSFCLFMEFGMMRFYPLIFVFVRVFFGINASSKSPFDYGKFAWSSYPTSMLLYLCFIWRWFYGRATADNVDVGCLCMKLDNVSRLSGLLEHEGGIVKVCSIFRDICSYSFFNWLTWLCNLSFSFFLYYNYASFKSRSSSISFNFFCRFSNFWSIFCFSLVKCSWSFCNFSTLPSR